MEGPGACPAGFPAERRGLRRDRRPGGAALAAGTAAEGASVAPGPAAGARPGGLQAGRLDAKHRAVELLKKGMRLDLGGIAKGYAMDEAMAVLQRHGIARALVEAGGDMRLGDPPPGRSGWRVGIPPLDNPQGEPLAIWNWPAWRFPPRAT